LCEETNCISGESSFRNFRKLLGQDFGKLRPISTLSWFGIAEMPPSIVKLFTVATSVIDTG